jgi:hypothetical protein
MYDDVNQCTFILDCAVRRLMHACLPLSPNIPRDLAFCDKIVLPKLLFLEHVESILLTRWRPCFSRRRRRRCTHADRSSHGNWRLGTVSVSGCATLSALDFFYFIFW